MGNGLRRQIASWALLAASAAAIVSAPASAGRKQPPAPSVPCGFLFTDAARLKPSKIKWNVRLDASLPVIDQGDSAACWTIQGSDSLNFSLRKAGILRPGDRLSYEFYYHAQLNEQLSPHSGMVLRDLPSADDFLESGAGFVADHFELIRKYGVVTEKRYRDLHKGVNGTKLGGEAYRARMKNAIRRMRRAGTWREAQAIFQEYVGNLRAFPLPDAETARALRSMRILHMLRTAEKGRRPYLEPADLLLRGVRASLDDGVPIVIGIDVDDEVFAMLSRRDSSARFRFKNGERYAHSMLVVGYKLDARGEVEHLLVRNSWGAEWGEDGLVTLDRKFLEFYLSDVEQVSTIEGYRAAYEKFERKVYEAD